MKNLIILLLLVVVLVSCGDRKPEPKPKMEYWYTTRIVLPDSNKVKMAEWITKTVAATNSHMTGGDYEEPEDVIEECADQAEDLFSVKEELLRYRKSTNDYWHDLTKDRMTKRELQILDSLKFNQRD